MRIAMIWKSEYPWDVRVEKICKTLIDDGHDVHLICRNLHKDNTRDEIEGIQIHRLFPIKTTFLNKMCSLPIFFNPFWFLKINDVLRSEKIEIIVVRDLPLSLSALLAGRISKIPVIFDMAENYVSLWKEHVNRKGFKFYNFILKNPLVASMIESYILKKLDHIIVVVEESKKRIIKKGVPEDKITIVSNTPELSIFNPTNSNVDIPDMMDGFKLLYVGFVTVGRGIDTVIKSIPLVNKQIPNIRFIIVGDGKYLKNIKMMSKELGIEKNVQFYGWVSFDQVPSYIRRSDICLVPHDATEHVNSTIPNKLFDYMACKKPVIVSDAAPLKRIVEQTKCGVVFKSRDSESFAEKVLELRDHNERLEKGENGYRAIISKYNWKRDSKNLKELIKKFGK